MKYILGKKIGMTQIFDAEGKAYPATVVQTRGVTITYIKTPQKDGYSALQFGFDEAKRKEAIKKPQQGHLKNTLNLKVLRETRVPADTLPQYKVGDSIGPDSFKEGEKVTVSAISKSKGFQGVVKRHGFAGMPRTHGQKHSEREAGSIGGGGRAGGRVVKGKKMAGRMGGERVTVKNLKVLGVNSAEHYLILSGAIPGRRGTLVEIRG